MRTRLWLFPVLLAVLVAGGWYFGARSKSSDRELPVYVTGGERMAAGEEIYRRGTDGKPFTYPPFAAVPFVPFAKLPAEWQPPLWFAVNFLLLLPIVWWLHRWALAGRSGAGPPRRGWMWVLVGLLALRHVLSVFENQSHDLVVFATAMLGVVAWVRGGVLGALLAGVAIGAAAAIKATPLLFLELFAVRVVLGMRDRRDDSGDDGRGATARAVIAAVALVTTVVGCSLLPDLAFPRGDGKPWLLAWYEVNLSSLSVSGTAAAAGAWDPHSILNQSLSGTLTRLFSAAATAGPFVRPDVLLVDLPAWLLDVVRAAGGLAVLGVIAWGVSRARRAALPSFGRWARLGECGMVLCGMVLLSPQSSKSHFCVLLVPAVFVVDRLLRGRRDLLLWLLAIAAAALATGTAKDILGRELGNCVLGYGAVTWTAVLLLLASLRSLGGVGAGAVRRDEGVAARLDADMAEFFGAAGEAGAGEVGPGEAVAATDPAGPRDPADPADPASAAGAPAP